MDRRDGTRQEVLVDASHEPITSMDALLEQCHRALSAHLWTACCWSKDGSGWKGGDFRYLIVSVAPDADTSLYVQFWSEPRERVLMEVGSGEWCPGALRYIGPAQRQALNARGYTVGGRARNFRKTLVIDSAAAAEDAALEVLQVFFEVFAYRGQWQLEVKRHRGERATQDAVYASVTPDDFAKLAVRAGCQATVTQNHDTPLVALTRGRRRFLALMDWRIADHNLFSLVTLQAALTLKEPVSDEAISRVNSTMQLVKAWRTDRHTVRLQLPLVLDGGVTAGWLVQSLQHWMRSWRDCERQFRRAAAPPKYHETSPRVELIQ